SEIIGHVFLCTHAPSFPVDLSHRTAIFLGGCGVLFVLTLVFAIQLQRLLKLKAVELEPLIPLVPKGVETVAESPEILPDEFRLLNRKVDTLSNKVEKIEQQLAKQPKESKPRVVRNSAEKPTVPDRVKKEDLTFTALDLNAITRRVVQAMQEDI